MAPHLSGAELDLIADKLEVTLVSSHVLMNRVDA